MAQWDLLLTQNVSAAGTEFTERLVHLNTGSLLTAGSDHIPVVLAAGTDGYVLSAHADVGNGTGLEWIALAAGHTQNTDTGTTSNTFEISSDGTAGSLLLDGAQAGGDYETKIVNTTQAGNIVLTLPSVTGILATEAYAAGLFASNDAMIFKGTVGSGGTHEISAFNALATYNAGWSYKVITAGTIKGAVCEIGDLVIAIVDRTGSSEADGDWVKVQTNIDGAVTGPASVSGGELAVFSGATGKVIAAGTGAPGTMAYETATNYVTKALYDADSLLFATSDNTPAMLLGVELPPKLWAAAPADKIGTGYTGTAIAGQIAKDANYLYVCETGGTATNQAWTRIAKATNW